MSYVRLIVAAAIAVASSMASAQVEEPYPSRPIRMIVPIAAGGGLDITARALGSWLQPKWGQPVVVENRPGADSNLGTEVVVRSPADGYTLLINSNLVAYAHLRYKSVTFEAARDLRTLGIVGGGGYVWTVPPQMPAKSLQEFIALAKANGRKMNLGSVGIGAGAPELEELLRELGVDIVPVQYKGMAAAVAAVASDEVQLALPGTPLAAPLVKAGRVRALAYTGQQRHPMLPDVPTIAEAGFPGRDAIWWIGLFAPAATPNAIAQKLNAAVMEISRTHEIQDRLQALGFQYFPLDLAQSQHQLEEMAKRAAEIFRRSGLKPE